MKRRIAEVVAVAVIGVFFARQALADDAHTRTIKIDRNWMRFPVKIGAGGVSVAVKDGGQTLREFGIELADGAGDWQAALDVSAWRGKVLTVTVNGRDDRAKGLAAVCLADDPVDKAEQYKEPLRPQYHFSPLRGWNNDPNGLAYFNGEYHLFFQHNPYGLGWGTMSWGHAVSKDMIHWQELGEGIYPDSLGLPFSGSAVVDTENTAGFGKGALVLVYTATGNGFTQCLRYSLDGRTFTNWQGNPVLKTIAPENRDPAVFWYAPKRHWVMVLYVERVGVCTMSFLTSPDLKTWKETDVQVGDWIKRGKYLYEFPSFYELPVAGTNEKRWVLHGTTGLYSIGTFDGERFTPEEVAVAELGYQGINHSAQKFNNMPDGRTVLMTWLHAYGPGMPFTQEMGVPQEVGLAKTPAGIRLIRQPIREIGTLRGPAKPLDGFEGGEFEAVVDMRLPPDAIVNFSFRGVQVTYSMPEKLLTANGQKVEYPLPDGHLMFRAFLDRISLEVFSGDGLVWLPFAVIPDAKNRRVGVQFSKGRALEDHSCVYGMKSIH